MKKLAQYNESGLTFQFQSDWKVIPFDKHRFYTWLSGEGFKGVDFLGIHPVLGLMLLEVKNYDQYEKVIPPFQLNDLEGFARHLIHKVADSLKLIRIVEAYYHRKYWFRFYRYTFSKYSRYQLLAPQWFFWIQVFEAVKKGNITFYLYLCPHLSPKDEQLLQQKIQKGLTETLPDQTISFQLLGNNSPKPEGLKVFLRTD